VPKLLEVQRRDLYKAMCLMLDSVTKEEFDATYRRMKATYTNNNAVLEYVEKGWVGNDSRWKKM
jgi:hypothetical protein